MSVLRVKKDKNYFAASNEPFNDERLSWEARGVMGYLLSKPDDWKLMFQDLINRGPAGEHKVRRILKELEKCEYLEREQLQDEEGKFYWVSTIYETSSIPRLSTHGLSTRGKPRDIESTKRQSIEEINEEEAPQTPQPREAKIIGEITSLFGGAVNSTLLDQVNDWFENYPLGWIEDAIETAEENEASHPNYISKVLSNRYNGKSPKKKRGDYDKSAFDIVREEMGIE